MVCGSILLGRRALAGKRGNESPAPNFWVPDCAAGLISEIANRSDCNQRSAGTLSPNADHWSGHAIGRSIRRLTPKPRGSRPSIAASTRAGQRKVSETVRRIQRSVLPSRAASDSMVWVGMVVSSSSPIENGFVHLPETAHWLADYLHELTMFPAGRYDDQVDSTAQALAWTKIRPPGWRWSEYCRQQLERANGTVS